MTVPSGFERHFRTTPVTNPWEPIYSRRADDSTELGLVIAEAHCNGRGFLHGGVIAALSDNAMGLSYVQLAQRNSDDTASAFGAVTVGLSVDYLSSARIGQWLQIAPRVLRAGNSLGFVDAVVTCDGSVVARCNATFKLATQRATRR